MSCICLPDKHSSETIHNLMKVTSGECNSTKALSFPPHFTLRGDFEIEDEVLPKLIKSMHDKVGTFPIFDMRVTDYGSYPWKVILLKINVTPELRSLHEAVMQTIQKFRTTWVPKDLIENAGFTGKQREYIEEYGYHFAFEYYSPHFTLASNDMSDKCFQDMQKKLQKEAVDISVVISTVALIDRDANNAITAIINLQ